MSEPKPIRVLVVEDHRMFADALRLLLDADPAFHPTGVVGTGEEAVEVCARECPDVVLMDIDLPRMDGIEATRRVSELCREAQVVVITALQPADVLAQAVDAGATGFVPKTEAAEQLLEVVRRAAGGEIVLPPGDTTRFLTKLREVHRARSNVERLLAQLTEREVQILQGLAGGKSTNELAQSLFISPHTVHSHVRSILGKLGVRSKLEAVLFALREGLITLPRGA